MRRMWINNSTLKLFQECRRKFYYQALNGLDLEGDRDRTASPAYFGTVIHAALEAQAEGKDWKDTIEQLIPDGCALRSKPDHLTQSLSHAHGLVESYLEFYGDVDCDWEVTKTEQLLEMPLGTIDKTEIIFFGTLDKEVINNCTRACMVVDHKTSSNPMRWVVPKIHLNPQFTGYIALALTNNCEADTLVVDMISTSLTDFKRGPSSLFTRQSTTRTASQIEEWRSDQLSVCASILRADSILDAFYPNYDSCDNFGGCSLKRFCQADPQIRTELIKDSFEVRDASGKLSFRLER